MLFQQNQQKIDHHIQQQQEQQQQIRPSLSSIFSNYKQSHSYLKSSSHYSKLFTHQIYISCYHLYEERVTDLLDSHL